MTQTITDEVDQIVTSALVDIALEVDMIEQCGESEENAVLRDHIRDMCDRETAKQMHPSNFRNRKLKE